MWSTSAARACCAQARDRVREKRADPWSASSARRPQPAVSNGAQLRLRVRRDVPPRRGRVAAPVCAQRVETHALAGMEIGRPEPASHEPPVQAHGVMEGAKERDGGLVQAGELGRQGMRFGRRPGPGAGLAAAGRARGVVAGVHTATKISELTVSMQTDTWATPPCWESCPRREPRHVTPARRPCRAL